MTELRDARLRRAMDEAPDASLRPPERTRAAILAAAHGAVQPAWRRWWPAGGQGRTPWTAAFATVLLAGFITLMWQGREIPGAKEEVAGADRQAPAVAPAPAPAPVVVPEAAPAAPAAAPAPPPPAAQAPPRERQRAARDERVLEAKREQAQRRAEQPAAAARRAEVAQAPADAAAPAAPSAPPAPPPPPSMADLMRPAPEPESLAKSQSAPSAGAVAPQRAPAPPAAAAAPSLRAAAPGVAWSQVRIEADGRSVVVPRAQAGRLASLVARMLQAGVDEAVASGPASLRLELALGEQATGVLEKVGEQWRWLPQGQPARVLRVDAALGTAAQQEAESLLRP